MENQQKIHVLYLDDEAHNLNSFRAYFRRKYDIITTLSPAEAEEILEKQDIHIILADQRMPGITGVEFFEKIRQLYPDPMRILITGYTDINAAIDAINKGEVFRFIGKPWDHDHVENTIGQAYEIYRTRADLRLRNLELQKAYEELDKFVYSASHDLRAPLMSVLGLVNLALMDEDVASQNQYLELIRLSVKKLDTFIINIIDYYKNARGTVKVEEIHFGPLIEEIRGTIAYLPEYQRLNVETRIGQTAPFRSDLMKLRLLFNNLITNALKFQDRGKDLSYLRIFIDIDAQQARIRFEDNGIGIEPENLDKIFSMFYTVGAQNSGSGIGLYIVNEAVKKLGGSINVSSIPGEGSIFELVIPTVNHEVHEV